MCTGSAERDRHDVDIGGVPYVVMVENLEKGISPFTIMEFIHQQVSISCQVLVSPSLSREAYTRATITVSSKKNQEKLCEFLENPNHSIISSKGRPWVLTEKWAAHDIPLASLQVLMANFQTMLQRRTKHSEELKVVLSGTEEYNTAKLLKELFCEFINHQARLHQRLLAEEAKITQLFDAQEM
ncbi:uncharacterized protein LOC126799909 [Argentina anserina]|uniref:uncharacterized protein LOC126799909 n=1 Tax=Argentina anserina TaxID=57926 RepID=UPI0021767BA6|nr:uncharacterized protein LOC126799909 [Potentilla anserina]